MNENVLKIKIEKIKIDNPNRVKRDIESDFLLMELKNNIQQYGMKIPLLVTKGKNDTYDLVDGYRRLQVCKLLGFSVVDCIVVDKNISNEIALSINLHREDLSPIEVGSILMSIYTKNKLIDSSYKYSNLSKLVNKSKAYISQHIGYIEKLSPTIQQDILDNKRMVDKNSLTRIYKLDEKNQEIIYNQMIKENLGREDVQKLISELSNDTNPKSDNSPKEPSKTDYFTLNTKIVEFKMFSNPLSDTDMDMFKSDLSNLLEKYNLNLEV